MVVFDARSAKTQIPHTVATYKLLRQYLAPTDSILDYSAGLGIGADELRTKSPNVKTYEPFPINWKSTRKLNYSNYLEIPDESADIVTNIFALNVVTPDVRKFIVRDIARIVKPMGRALFVVRDKINAKTKIPAGIEENAFFVLN